MIQRKEKAPPHHSSQINLDLTQEEKVMIQGLVSSPVFGVLRKVYAQAERQWTELMLSIDKEQEVFRMQGRIQGARYLQNAPVILADALNRKNSQPKAPANPL